ncbi:hypothetical protein M2152_001067 [Microbacteriaceae bacterium SG_E_30_P1]|uniref:DUF1761 domain-containing protein n=1 Tax=Antiquaquibacter oligotrophicus TaxID=2880260 RepID=A0ABT6KLI8_9MICO|nr:DUF1761 domain-containing protein [Antiquaquibacter oligotrophicus]MDH6180885.1 hypothetical protein [Antiquaquibacter oligotrophicus]UDF13408.1 DUF1761 domain-containing protein [Antiquaquibacter oligotrophicus]
MTVPEINWIAVILATLSTLIIGSVWYSKAVFGKRWIRLAKIDESNMGSAVGPIVVTIVVSFITALVLAGAAAIAQNFYGGNFLVNTLVTAVILWAGFTAARVITHDAFERRPAGLTILTIGHELVTMLVMGLIIGLFGISAA